MSTSFNILLDLPHKNKIRQNKIKKTLHIYRTEAVMDLSLLFIYLFKKKEAAENASGSDPVLASN